LVLHAYQSHSCHFTQREIALIPIRQEAEGSRVGLDMVVTDDNSALTGKQITVLWFFSPAATLNYIAHKEFNEAKSLLNTSNETIINPNFIMKKLRADCVMLWFRRLVARFQLW
jgi:aspartate carbamoyltransferase regulatory subunit